ncbi:hypothetical protein [Caudoviricetes sp.]|nr:hypothetical protein [Caudoviricetes sp.]
MKPTTPHKCAIPKKADPSLVWQCNCGQYWLNGAAVAAIKAREAAAEQAYQDAADALAERSATLQKNGYGPKLGARSVTQPDTDRELWLIQCHEWVYWQHATGKSYLMMLRKVDDHWLIDTRWCKTDLLNHNTGAVPNIEDRVDNNRINGLLTAVYGAGDTLRCKAAWLAGIKKRLDHGYTITRCTPNALSPNFLIGL